MKRLLPLLLFGLLKSHAFGSSAAVQFEIDLPAASSVFVAGEFNNWSQEDLPLTKNSAGIWTGKTYVPAGTYGYKIIVDGEWILDPEATDTIERDGVINSRLDVQAAALEIIDENTPFPTAKPMYRTWTSVSGSTIDALFIKTEFNNVYLEKTDGKTIRISLNALQAEDQRYIQNEAQRNTTPQPNMVMPDGRIRLGKYLLPTEVLHRITVPCSPVAYKQAKRLANLFRDSKSVSPLSDNCQIEVGILLPPEFDPARTWPILLVNAPSDFSNIGHLECCFMPAGECGYIAIAADGPVEGRWTMAGSALQYLHQHWPQSKEWPVACAGFSGGAKMSGYFGSFAIKSGYNCIGVWMGGCNNDYASKGMRVMNTKSYRKTPMYLASGTTDEIATPAHHQKVYQSLKNSSFDHIRLETYEGGHHPVPQDKVKEGLLWFLEMANLSE